MRSSISTACMYARPTPTSDRLKGAGELVALKTVASQNPSRTNAKETGMSWFRGVGDEDCGALRGQYKRGDYSLVVKATAAQTAGSTVTRIHRGIHQKRVAASPIMRR